MRPQRKQFHEFKTSSRDVGQMNIWSLIAAIVVIIVIFLIIMALINHN